MLISRISQAKLTTTNRFSAFSVRFWRRILMIKRKIRISFQNELICIYELTISFELMSEQTNKIYLKSSQKQTILSSKRICSWTSMNEHKFNIMRLTINMSYLRCMSDSFQKISLIFCIKLTRSNFLNLSQKLWASKFRKILKWTCAIESSFNKMIVMSNEITTNTIISFERNLFITMFCTKILFVSFESFKKNNWFILYSLSRIIATTISVANCWSSLNKIHWISTSSEFEINVNFSRMNLFFSATNSLKSIMNSNKSNAVRICWSFLKEIWFNKSANKYKFNCWFWYCRFFTSSSTDFDNAKYWRSMMFLQFENNLNN